jgi:CheY-like chemotaxis protein
LFTPKSVPAIAVTAYANPEDQVRSAVAGYQLHLAKPVDPERVAAAIASVATPRPRPVKPHRRKS